MLAELRSLVGESKGFDLRALEPFRAEGLHTAMYIVPMLATILAVVLFAASRTVKKDVGEAAGLDARVRHAGQDTVTTRSNAEAAEHAEPRLTLRSLRALRSTCLLCR